MISPSGSTGAKMAERAPMTMRARPWRILCHSSWRSPAERWLCSTATKRLKCRPELKRALNRSTVCGVSEISGTSTMAPLPALQRARDRLEVNLRLARARDAVEQERAAPRDRRAWSAGSILDRPRRVNVSAQAIA